MRLTEDEIDRLRAQALPLQLPQVFIDTVNEYLTARSADIEARIRALIAETEDLVKDEPHLDHGGGNGMDVERCPRCWIDALRELLAADKGAVPPMSPDPDLIDDAEGGRGGAKRIARSKAAAERELLEEGRRLANQRDDLMAHGANPADLAIPAAPLSEVPTEPRTS